MERLTTVLAALFLCLAMTSLAAPKKFTLVIDAGHGGHDAGAIGSKAKEKNINLSVALAFGRLVEANCPDVKVIYTRKTDVFIPLHERADIANRNKADLFISIHTNALPKGRRAEGMETYTLGMNRADDNLEVAKRENSVILIEEGYEQRYQGFDPNSSESYIMFEFLQDLNMEQSVELARMVQKRCCAATGRQDKGVKQAGFLVLRETSMPSCLIELGFISTPSEEQYLISSGAAEAYGRGIYQAFLDYKNKYSPGGSSAAAPYKAENNPPPTAKTPPQEPKNQAEAPIFKVQILASDKKLKQGDKRLKGESSASFYVEGGMYKYVIGSSTDYYEINDLRKRLQKNFPDAFIVAFKGGQRVDTSSAINEFKNNNNNR